MLRFKVKHNRKQKMLTREIKKATINFIKKNLHQLDVSRIQQAKRCIIRAGSMRIFQQRIEKLL